MKKLLTTISTITLSITLSLSLLLTPILTSPTLASEVSSPQLNSISLSITSIKPTKVTLNCKTTTLNTGLTTTLTPTILPSNATNKSVTWKSSNTKIATVENGLITAIKAGKSTITVTTVDNKKTAKCIVTVKTAPITTITSISDITQTINQNDDYTLPSTVVAAMSNNTTKQLPIIWNPSDVNTSNSGIYYFYGKVIGWNDDVKLTLTINSTALIVSSIANVSITTTAGTAPILPYQVVATMSDRTTKNVNVTWVAPLTSQYASVGTFIVNGSIAESFTIKAIANVTVVNPELTISSIANINKTINQNDVYSLPSTIEAIMSDNSRKQVSVIWSPSDVNTSIVGNYKFIGTVEDTTIKASLTIIVLEKQLTIKEVQTLILGAWMTSNGKTTYEFFNDYSLKVVHNYSTWYTEDESKYTFSSPTRIKIQNIRWYDSTFRKWYDGNLITTNNIKINNNELRFLNFNDYGDLILRKIWAT